MVQKKQQDDKNVRIIQKQVNGSTTVTLPADLLRELAWKEKQKVVVKKRGTAILIELWKKPVVAKK
jgi:antitoxin component of MazEF toxin-antitoxin module